MKIFEERERAIEAEWALRAERQTRVHARRNRLFAEWAASATGLSGIAASERALNYVKLYFEPHGEDAMLERVAADLDCSVDTLREELGRCERQARDEVGD